YSLQHLISAPPHISWMTIFFAALAFAFFKLGVGMGTMIVYGSYLPNTVSLGRSTLIIVIVDALIALLAYFVLFPLIYTLTPEVLGERLNHYNVIFVFMHIPHGLIVAALFFFAAILAAWTPMIAMAETVTVTLIERCHLLRRRSTAIIGLLLLCVGTF